MMIPLFVFLLRLMMVAALFAFLAWAMITLWKDLKFQSQMIGQKKTPGISITMDNDPQAEKLQFTQNEIVIGREETCDIFLNDPAISSRHARLIHRNMHWWLEDLNSTNGSFLNDERVESPVILINGDEMRVGRSILVVEIETTS